MLLLLQVLEAEASSPLVTAQHLQDAGNMPRVLVQGTAGGLVATPAAQERQEMYNKENEYTGAREGDAVACWHELSHDATLRHAWATQLCFC
jgi:hypothetical protein